MSVKLFALAKRKPGMSIEAFLDHWRHPHGTLAKQVKLVTGYVQHRPIACDRLGMKACTYDGIAELEVATEADAAAFGNDPDYVRDLIPDEEKFIDRNSLTFLCVTDNEQDLLQEPRRSLQPADALWQKQRQNVSTQILQFSSVPMPDESHSGDEEALAIKLGALRFNRYRPSRAIHGETPPFTGVRQLAWPTTAAFERGTHGKDPEWRQLFGAASSSLMVVSIGDRVT